GERAHQNASSQNPSFHFTSEGLVAGFDWLAWENNLAGGAIGYAHSDFHDADHAGHGDINYYFVSLYSNHFINHFYVSPAIWGLFNKIDNTRNIQFPGFSAQAEADIFAGQFMPHLEIGYDLTVRRIELLLFTSIDWPISWQRSYKE